MLSIRTVPTDMLSIRTVPTDKSSDSPSAQIEHLERSPKTSERIAKDYGIGQASERRAEEFAKGVDAAESRLIVTAGK